MGPLLDIGCGVGGFLDFAADNQLCRYGFDASDAQVRLAKERHPNVRTCTSIEKYIELIPHAPKFELVTMWDVLEHIRDPHTLLQNVRKHMAPTGLFFASVPSGAPLRTKLMLAKLRGREPGLVPWEHVFYYTKCSLRRLLAMNGFDVLAVDGVVAYIRTLSNHEIARRIAHRLLLHTPYALQIFVLAMPSR